MSINLHRVFNFALKDFYRNKGISITAIFVLSLTILLVTAFFFIKGASTYLVETIQSKIDITAYFKEDTREQDMLSARDEILNNSPNIKSVVYVSKEDALADFMEKHKDSKDFSKAIMEVGGNPFLPSLNIITIGGDSSQYEEVANILQGSQFSSIIEKVDFSEKRVTIEKVFSITKSINRIGLFVGLVLVLIAVSVVFNTIKLIIDRAKDEISTMKIVGASNWFIKAPFVIEGGIFGLIASITCLFITILLVYSLSHFLSVVMPGFNLLGYFISNFWIILLIQLVSGIGLGILSSLIVVRKYLEV
ncbi:MAG: permease-like cell division protein FtsX [Patescibacteria group bacterium]